MMHNDAMLGPNPFRSRWSAIIFAAGVIWFACDIASNPPQPADRLGTHQATPQAAGVDNPTPAAEPSTPVAEPTATPAPQPVATDVVGEPVAGPDVSALANISVH